MTLSFLFSVVANLTQCLFPLANFKSGMYHLKIGLESQKLRDQNHAFAKCCSVSVISIEQIYYCSIIWSKIVHRIYYIADPQNAALWEGKRHTFNVLWEENKLHLFIPSKNASFLGLAIFPIDDVTCDVMPGSMRTNHSNIHCSFAWQFAYAWSGHVLLKLPPSYTSPVQSSAVVHLSVSINQSLAFVVNKHLSHHLQAY